MRFQACLPALGTPLPADPSDALAGGGDVASPPLGPGLDEDDPGDGSESFSEEDEGYAVRTGRRGRDTATHPPSDHDESPARITISSLCLSASSPALWLWPAVKFI